LKPFNGGTKIFFEIPGNFSSLPEIRGGCILKRTRAAAAAAALVNTTGTDEL
jgi:hypothetical protein